MSACSVEDCPSDARARGWCLVHYHRARRRGGDPLGIPPRYQPKTCIIDGCDRRRHSHGWCRLHWRRARDSGGDPQPDRPMRGEITEDGRKWCTGCDRLLTLDSFHRSATRPDGRAGHCRDCTARYRRENPTRRSANEQRRRAAKRSAAGDCSAAQLEARWAYYGGRCWCCGAAAEATDHVKPLAKGGSNWPANLRPICTSCNSSKRDTWPLAA